MNFKGLGELKQNEQFKECWESREVEVPYFDNAKLKFIVEIDGDEPIDDFEVAVSNFLKLDAKDRLQASKHVYKNYKEFMDSIEDEDIDISISDEKEVWKYVHPTQIIVSRRSHGNKLVYVQILTECDWEIEHGLQIVYREGKELSRVSACDGHLTHADAFGLPEEEDRIC